MELLSIMLNVITPIMLVMSFGYIIGKKFDPDPRSLSVYLIYLFTPALVFKGVYEAELSGALLGVGVVAIFSAISMAIIGFVVARVMNYSTRGESSLILTITLVNAANYGISLNTFAYGDEGGNIAIFYYVVSAVIGNIFGVFFASRGTVSARSAFSNVFKVPILYAAIIGLLMNYYQIGLPLVVQRSVIELAAPASIPLMLGLLGLQLSRVSFSTKSEDVDEDTLATNLSAVGIAAGLKLLVAPFIAIGFASLMGLSGLNFNVAVIESSMPTAVLASALATQFGGDARFVSAVTLIGTLASIITLSILIFILGGTV
ncbi:MAG: AEC family transporter [Phototrophicaceae bacterium]